MVSYYVKFTNMVGKISVYNFSTLGEVAKNYDYLSGLPHQELFLHRVTDEILE